ncbi:hypothetical protein EYZ11_012136 [Aspergillus tanneri]|uniref:Ketoreductase (KR) domain-containing protein n=1 Tax=Aspergillus tanneri TaxID=1220188 RepID=A0A4S3J347_9EURO|nr:hypothetical protein EYZ11_012136 [Aspergillus tanneri]
MSDVVLLTGANQGVEYAILRVASVREPPAVYIFCSRDFEAGNKAKQELQMEGVQETIDSIRLDVTNDEQILFLHTRSTQDGIYYSLAGINPKDDAQAVCMGYA